MNAVMEKQVLQSHNSSSKEGVWVVEMPDYLLEQCLRDSGGM